MRFNLEEYEPVESRLARFWRDHPQGRVETRLLSDPNALDECVIWSGIWFNAGDEHPRGTGHASEKRGSGGANNTAHVENAETSAIGRALANCGYSGDRRASREEMAKVNHGQQTAPQRTPAEQAAVNLARPSPPAPTGNPDQPRCAWPNCGTPLTNAQKSYSVHKFGRALCLPHQDEAKEVAADEPEPEAGPAGTLTMSVPEPPAMVRGA